MSRTSCFSSSIPPTSSKVDSSSGGSTSNSPLPSLGIPIPPSIPNGPIDDVLFGRVRDFRFRAVAVLVALVGACRLRLGRLLVAHLDPLARSRDRSGTSGSPSRASSPRGCRRTACQQNGETSSSPPLRRDSSSRAVPPRTHAGGSPAPCGRPRSSRARERQRKRRSVSRRNHDLLPRCRANQARVGPGSPPATSATSAAARPDRSWRCGLGATNVRSTSASPAALVAATVRSSGGTPRCELAKADPDRGDGKPNRLGQPESVLASHPLERAPVHQRPDAVPT